MSQTKYRAQILLEREQHQALSEIAAQRQQSLSHVVREIVGDYLSERDVDLQQRHEIQAIEKLSQLRQEVMAKHGSIQADLLAESRAERELELQDRNAISR